MRFDVVLVVLDQPDPFVESLQHDSIIVQIPLLRGKENNHLEKVLSVFDQTLAYEEDRRVLRVDESQYAGDGEMEYIVHRLQSAAADPEMRYQMNAEAEFFKALEDRDTAIMEQTKLIEKKNADLLEQEKTIKQKDADLLEQEKTIKQKDADLFEQLEMLRRMVENLTKNGMDDAMVMKMTGLTEEQIRKLKQSLSHTHSPFTFSIPPHTFPIHTKKGDFLIFAGRLCVLRQNEV